MIYFSSKNPIMDSDSFELDVTNKQTNDFLSSLSLLDEENKLRFIIENWNKLSVENLEFALDGAEEMQERIEELEEEIETVKDKLQKKEDELEEIESDDERFYEQMICNTEVGELMEMVKYLPNEMKFEYLMGNWDKITEDDLRKIVDAR